MQNEINKKNIRSKNSIHLPFDGTAKSGEEIARMVGEALLKLNEEVVDVVFPTQWAMTPVIMLHPVCGVFAFLDNVNANYRFTGFARNGAIGVRATRCC